MNPFTESTVALPLNANTPARGPQAAARGPERQGQAQAGLRHDARAAPRAGGRQAPPRQAPAGRPMLAHPRRCGAGAQPFSYLCRRAAGAVLAAGLALALPAKALAVDVNTATPQQLETVTGIGPKTAQLIVEERARAGRYESFDDLAERVKGIGPKKAASLKTAGLTVGAGRQAPAAAKASAGRQGR